MDLDTDQVTFPPRAISRQGTRRVLDFLRRADRAWRSGVFDLSGMDMDELPTAIIELFPDVTRLLVDANPIAQVPSEFAAMTRLEELRFDRGAMRSPSLEIWGLGLDRTFEFMRKITALRRAAHPQAGFARWGLGRIPDEVFDPALVGRLTRLDFGDNALDALPAEVERMAALEHLVLVRNRLAALPESVGRLTRLETLHLDDNALEAFPDRLRTMVALRVLSLPRNRLSALPPSVVDAPALVEVLAADNRVGAVPERLSAATALRVLDLTNNTVERLPLEVGHCTLLRALHLEGNVLWSPPPDVMAQPRAAWLRYLRQLDASQASCLPPTLLPHRCPHRSPRCGPIWFEVFPCCCLS
jgi:Leucine-rich repeat (LRR) protein